LLHLGKSLLFETLFKVLFRIERRFLVLSTKLAILGLWK